MEVNYLNLFYMGIAYDCCIEKGKKFAKTGLPVKKLGREFPYLLGSGRAGAGRLLVYHALLPEYRGKSFLTGKPQKWKGDTLRQIVEKTGQRAAAERGCRAQVLAPELGGSPIQIPPELLAVCLYRCRPFDRLAFSLAEEGGEYGLEQLLELAGPYLPRVRQVMLIGEESPLSEQMEDYLYGEFGIIMTRGQKAPADFVWLDFAEKEGVEKGTDFSEKSRKINRKNAWKFLDTTVKNGYNT
ncbi:MAG: hypothetical protein NC400_14865 [Clostridium sp.]|nr:hypothetical protein [Clostridium sp.]